MTARAVRGTKDLFGKELRMHQRIVATARKVLEAAGALELVTPIFEETQVFETGAPAPCAPRARPPWSGPTWSTG